MRAPFAPLIAAFTLVCLPSVSAQGQASMAPGIVAGADSVVRGMRRVRLSVATRALQRGDTVRASDIAVVDTNIVWRWSTIAPDTVLAVAGWIAHRAIAVGEALRYPAVGAPPVVTAGSRVSLIYQDGPLRILLTGVATNSAAQGAAVGVRIDPARRLDGIAVAPNTVRFR